jgi:hypothetical protein
MVKVLLATLFLRRAKVTPELAAIPARTGKVTGCCTRWRFRASSIASTWTQDRLQ